MSRIGIDLDDVGYPWSDTAHECALAAGITNGAEITQWKMWKDYGCTEQQLWDVLGQATLDGTLYTAPPFPGFTDQLQRLHTAGHTIHFVTARGFLQHGHLIRTLTVEWLDRWQVPHDSLTFSGDKTLVDTDWFIDDSIRNYDALAATGTTRPRLLNRPHNQPSDETDDRCRVDTVREFVDEILGVFDVH